MGDFLGHRPNIFPGTMRSSRSWQFSLKSNNLKSQISNLKSFRRFPGASESYFFRYDAIVPVVAIQSKI